MSSYSSVQDHHSMFFDDLRNTLYAQAIDKEVAGESVVLDLGAGLGLHGFMAIESGAKKAYLVEPTAIIEITRQVVEANKLAGKIECIRGKIEEVELPQKVDCIISVLTGNFLLTEDLLPSLFYARDHFLRPGGKLIPNRAKMEVVPVSAGDYYAKHIDCWNSVTTNAGFQAVRKFAVNDLYYDGPQNREAEFLADPVELLDIDFMTATEASCRNRIEVEVTRGGLCHGWLGWFRTRLGEKWLSTSPLEKQTHWSQVFLPLAKPISVKKGEALAFELDRPEFGEWSWIVEHGDETQRHSTFLSEPISLTILQKKSDSHKPRISEKGVVALEVLTRLTGDKSTAEIVKFVMAEYAELFPTRKLADRFVKALVGLHGA